MCLYPVLDPRDREHSASQTMAHPWRIPATAWMVVLVAWWFAAAKSMSNAWSIPATGCMVFVASWWFSPSISFYLQVFSCLISDGSEELRKLELDTVPALQETLRVVEKERMLGAASDWSRQSDLKILDVMDRDLKSALREAKDILDLVDYHRIEKEVTRYSSSWVLLVLLLQTAYVYITPASLQKLLQRLKHQLGRLFGAITSFCRAVLSWSMHNRDCSYEQVGIQSNQQMYGILPVAERIRVRKKIKFIELILTSANKADLYNQNTSSTVKNNGTERSSKQKEIDDLYSVIGQKVFGRDKDRKLISEMLRKGPGPNAASSSTSKPYSVIGIYGITGSGKSTLAQHVCAYEKGAGHFNPIMFIHVGRTLRVRHIFLDMLDQITQQRTSDTNADRSLKSLRAELQKQLKGKCFLLVLDDLWVNDDSQLELDILLDMLRVSRSGSRILGTAQKRDAAAALGAQESMQIPIPDLEEEQYLSMFMHYSLGLCQVTSTDYGIYEAIGRKIAKKLGRSPIAARTVAARLQRNNNIDFWKTTANLDVLNETMGALWWSYQQLGVDIRQCLTYCSIFPKGYEINRDELVRLWIAQGFVKTRNNATEELKDICQSYFDQLLTFSFLQVQRKTSFGEETMVLTIHDLLHELVERVSGSEFYRIGLNGIPKDIPRGVHHLFIQNRNVAEITEKILDLGNLRTLIIMEPFAGPAETMERNQDLEEVLECLFMRMKKLRVLIIKLNCYAKEFLVPTSIEHMKHLRYIAFHFPSVLCVRILPGTFHKLYHIQNIDIPCLEASSREDIPRLEASSLKREKIARLISVLLSFLDVEVVCPPKAPQEINMCDYKDSRYPSWMVSRQHNGFKPLARHNTEDELGIEALHHILYTSEEPIELSYVSLQIITNNFSQEIGRGGFGVVYMGFHERRNIAVKKLWVPKDLSDMKFEEELKCLIRVKHKNIVRFLGYCSDTIEKPMEYNGKFVVAEEWQRFLCFEYVPNKSLRDYLKDESHGHEWDIRYQLINGICQGLCYLHNKERIIHLDLKPENILLDDDMVPKIADFGISRLFTAEKSRTITKKILGSRPYMAPEYLNKGEITFKCDIFSLGAILKELLLGNNDFSNHENWHQSPYIDNPQLKRCIEVAQMCVNEDPSKRPDIDGIINMLSEQR